jgi:hypothetical protein
VGDISILQDVLNRWIAMGQALVASIGALAFVAAFPCVAVRHGHLRFGSAVLMGCDLTSSRTASSNRSMTKLPNAQPSAQECRYAAPGRAVPCWGRHLTP